MLKNSGTEIKKNRLKNKEFLYKNVNTNYCALGRGS